jgi:hypothetical protein
MQHSTAELIDVELTAERVKSVCNARKCVESWPARLWYIDKMIGTITHREKVSPRLIGIFCARRRA